MPSSSHRAQRHRRDQGGAAASLALRGDGSHVIPLDACIETRRQTGHDMILHKKTSTGGLVVNLPEC